MEIIVQLINVVLIAMIAVIGVFLARALDKFTKNLGARKKR